VDEDLLRRMTEAIRHRGPDDGGVWTDGTVGLGARRLSIIDVSDRGHQPMTNEDGSIRLVFNGEVYNFAAIRRDLEARGHRFRSDTDTETIVHLYEEEGAACVERLRGMFAFALWDAPRRRLLLARDRLGKKPLVYYQDSRQLLFASAPKAILQDPSVPAEPDPHAIHHYLTYGYVPGPQSAFKGFRKLPPAHWLLFEDGRATIHRYWSLRYTPKRGGSEAELGEELLALLGEAVSLRLRSDVPLGALLSGGIDSSAVVALMRRLTSGTVRTFSIGSDHPEYDELPFARAVAARFGTDHHELVVKPDAAAALPHLAWHYDEPFADSSALPSFAVCGLARQHVTVALSGDGGDENFLGYQRYLATVIAGQLDRTPAVLRRAVVSLASALPRTGPRSLGSRWRRLAAVLQLEPKRRYLQWLTADDGWKTRLYSPGFEEMTRSHDSFEVLAAAYARSDAPTFVEQTAHADVQLYLPDDLLVKMDVASMASSLEVRSPFLDHQVVEFAASLPPGLKIRGLVQKYLLKQVMQRMLPDQVVRRRKRGFGVPIDHWFRRELREMAYDVLLDARASARGYFRPETLRQYLDDHVQRRADHHARLWTLLMLELWHRTFIDAPCPVRAPAI
jgi:asparagine synthase (glutamine-hydrolysing)